MKKVFYLFAFLVPFTASSQYIGTVAGNNTAGNSGDGGLATAAAIGTPAGLAIDAAGNLYIADATSHVVRRVAPDGTISTYAGTGVGGYGGDGIQATAANLNTPSKLAFDAAGNLYIADALNNRVRRVSPSGLIYTVAGKGNLTSYADGIPAVLSPVYGPYAVRINAAGDMFIADTKHNRIRKVSGGVITTIAGTGTNGNTGDGGPATAANIDEPMGLSLDAAGNIYFTQNAHFSSVRKIDAAGNISTIAGTGTAGLSGDGGPAISAQFSGAAAVATDAAGNVYIADGANCRIRKINTAGTISTFVGSECGYSGHGVMLVLAKMRYVNDIVFDAAGDMYISDAGNHVVRKIFMPTATPTLSATAHALKLHPNPAHNEVVITTPTSEPCDVTIINALGQTVLTQSIQQGTHTLSIATLPTGIYTVRATVNGQSYLSKLVKE